MKYIGDFAEDATIRIVFTTNDGSGGAVAPSDAFEAADFIIYKNGSATQKATTNGITVTSPFDTVTGLHQVVIDTSVDTGDVGFWDKSSDYTVVLSPDTETVDSQTVVAEIASFSIENRFVGNGVPSVNVAQISGDSTAANNLEALLDGTGGVTLSGDLSGSVGSISGVTFPTNFSDLAITASTGLVSVGTNNDKTGYSLTQTFPANFSDLAITASTGLVSVGTNNDKTGYSLTQTFPTNFADLAITAGTGEVDVNSLSSTAENQVAAQTAVGLATVGVVTESYLDSSQSTQTSAIQSEFTTIKGATWSSSTDTLEAIRDASGGGGGATSPQILVSTTIATLASQTSFTLTAGSADDDAYNNMMVVVTDSATSTQKAVGFVSDYVGSTRTVTLKSDPGVFTMAVGDAADIIAVGADMPTIAARFDDVDLGFFNVGLATTNIQDRIGTPSVDLVTDIAAIDTKIGTPVDGSLADDIYNTDQRVFTVKNDTATTLSRIGLPSSDLATELAAVDTVVDGIKAVTDNLPDSGALTTLSSAVSTVDTVVDGIKAVTDNLPDSGALTTLASNISSILADTGTDGVAISTAQAKAIAAQVLMLAASDPLVTSIPKDSLLRVILATGAGKIARDDTNIYIYEPDGTTILATLPYIGNASLQPIGEAADA